MRFIFLSLLLMGSCFPLHLKTVARPELHKKVGGIRQHGDNDFTLNLLRYGEVRFMLAFFASISKSPMASSRGRTAQCMASMANYLVRNGYFAKQKDARLLIRQNVQRGMRSEIDEGKTAHEMLFAALLFHQMQDRQSGVMVVSRVMCDD